MGTKDHFNGWRSLIWFVIGLVVGTFILLKLA